MASIVKIIQYGGLIWVRANERATPDHLGFIPEFLSERDPRPAAEQFRENYIGGWDSFKGFDIPPDATELRYPGDPPLPLLWATRLRDETVCVYDCGWVAIMQPDGAYDVARLN